MNFFQRNAKAILTALGLLGVVVAGLVLLAASFLADLATKIPPTARPSLSPARMGMVCEDVELKTEDGLRLSAWWMPNGKPGRAPVVILHGLGASKAHMIDYILLSQEQGNPTLAIDFRGHGGSDPSLTSIGFYESRDVETAMQFVRQKGAGDPVLWGTSMGAVSALLAAAKDGSAAGVIADAPFDTYRNTVLHHAQLMYGLSEYPFVALAFPMIESRARFRIADVDCLQAAGQIRAPLLVLAGEKDERMPIPVVRSVYDRAAGPKEFWVIPGEGHENRGFGVEFRKKISEFLGKLKKS